MKKVKVILVIFIVFLSIIYGYIFGYRYNRNVIYIKDKKINELKSDTLILRKYLSEYELDLKAYNKLINDKDYIRYLAFKHSDIVIPKNINESDLKLIYRLSIKFKIPQRYIYRLIHKESRFKSDAKSHKGAKGYMQVMPDTFRRLKPLYENEFNDNLNNYTNNHQNIIIGTYLLRRLYKKYNNWDLVFAAYNAGSGNVKNAGNKIPNIKETKNYVKFIKK